MGFYKIENNIILLYRSKIVYSIYFYIMEKIIS